MRNRLLAASERDELIKEGERERTERGNAENER